MIQIILMLLGLAFSNNNANNATTANDNNPATVTTQSDAGSGEQIESDNDTSGETGNIPPPKK